MIAVLPGLVVAIVNLFYNSAGGVLMLLGNLLSLLPHPAVPDAGGASLPAFQVLTADTTGVLLRAGAATLLCSLALALLVAGQHGTAQHGVGPAAVATGGRPSGEVAQGEMVRRDMAREEPALPRKTQPDRVRLVWSAVAICCGLAAMIGGQPVALALLPALLISILRLIACIRQTTRR